MQRLVADVGGTNARFALVPAGSLEPEHIIVLPCADYTGPVDAVKDYLERVSVAQISEAIFALGTPIVSDSVKMTNNHWVFTVSELSSAFAIPEVRLVNDFTALATAVPHLGERGLHKVGGGMVVDAAPKGVIGPGTGLGVSGLVCDGQGGWIPLAGEGGHVTLAPRSDREFTILQHVARERGHVSAERLLSGPGLVCLYRALCAIDGHEPLHHKPSDILASALEDEDDRAIECLNTFCSLLGTCAGNLALTLGAVGGVYIGGGIVPRMLDFFEQSPFRQTFEEKGRASSVLAPIATLVITEEYPALLGTALMLRH